MFFNVLSVYFKLFQRKDIRIKTERKNTEIKKMGTKNEINTETRNGDPRMTCVHLIAFPWVHVYILLMTIYFAS